MILRPAIAIRGAAVCVLLALSGLVPSASASLLGDPVPLSGVAAGGVLGAARASNGTATLAYYRGAYMYSVVVGGGAPQRIGPFSLGGQGLGGSVDGGPVPAGSVVGGSDGSRLVAWDDANTRRGVLRAAIAPPNQAFGTAHEVEATTDTLSDVHGTFTSNGTAALIWLDASAVEVSIATPGAAWGLPITLSHAATSAQVATAPDGSIVAAWLGNDGAHVATLAPGAATFGPAQIAPLPANSGGWIGLGVLPDGTVLITTTGAAVARMTPSGTFESSEQLPVTADFSTDVATGVTTGDLAVASDGSAALTLSGENEIWLATAPPGGSFGRPLALGDNFDPAQDDVFAWPATPPMAFFQGGYDAEGVGVFSNVFAPSTAAFDEAEPSSAQQQRDTLSVVSGITSVAVAGPTPHSLALFLAYGPRIYEIVSPGTPDHRTPIVSLEPADACDSGLTNSVGCETTIWITADKEVTFAARATVLSGGRWRAAAARFVQGDFYPHAKIHYSTTDEQPPFLGSQLEIPVSGLTTGCHNRVRRAVRVAVTVRDDAGDVTHKALAFTAHCNL